MTEIPKLAGDYIINMMVDNGYLKLGWYPGQPSCTQLEGKGLGRQELF